MPYIEFNHIVKEYGSGEASIKALDDASFYVEKGELAVILGSSGAGRDDSPNILGEWILPVQVRSLWMEMILHNIIKTTGRVSA